MIVPRLNYTSYFIFLYFLLEKFRYMKYTIFISSLISLFSTWCVVQVQIVPNSLKAYSILNSRLSSIDFLGHMIIKRKLFVYSHLSIDAFYQSFLPVLFHVWTLPEHLPVYVTHIRHSTLHTYYLHTKSRPFHQRILTIFVLEAALSR